MLYKLQNSIRVKMVSLLRILQFTASHHAAVNLIHKQRYVW